MNQPIHVSTETLPYCCGVMDVGAFFTENGFLAATTIKNMDRSGTGLFTATFINNNTCREAYEQMCESHTLLFQSEPYKNMNSRNKVFLCVFKHGKPKKKKGGSFSTWPEPFEREGEILPKL